MQADLTLQRAAELVRTVGEDAAMAFRLGRDLRGFLRAPLTVEEARRRVRHRLEHREQYFLDVAQRAIYALPKSPYRRLLAHAGCEFGDLRTLVGQEGIEGALRILAARGVYVSFDEFKGRRAAVRGSARFTFSDRDFDNPLAASHYMVLTGGTRGRPTRIGRSLDSVAEGGSAFLLTIDAHGIRNPRHAYWLGPSPSMALIHLKLGQRVVAWFYPIHPQPLIARAGIAYLSALVAMTGRSLPPLQHCDVQEPEPIVRWLLANASNDRPVVLNTTSSSAVRIASTAAGLGRPLAGVALHCRSEPLTAARRRQVEDAGARVLTSYASTELPYIGYCCATGVESDDLHLFEDRHAVVEREHVIEAHGLAVSALLFSSLSAAVGKIAFNTELGDSARLEQRDCGCELGELGLRTHLSGIRSFEKLSSEGTSFARSNLVTILEDVLPARFGGTPLDYQLVEEEGASGSGLLILRVHPAVGDVDDDRVRAVLLEELARGDMVQAYQSRLIERAQSVVIRRLPPLATQAGKVLPFHLVMQEQPSP